MNYFRNYDIISHILAHTHTQHKFLNFYWLGYKFLKYDLLTLKRIDIVWLDFLAYFKHNRARPLFFLYWMNLKGFSKQWLLLNTLILQRLFIIIWIKFYSLMLDISQRLRIWRIFFITWEWFIISFYEWFEQLYH